MSSLVLNFIFCVKVIPSQVYSISNFQPFPTPEALFKGIVQLRRSRNGLLLSRMKASFHVLKTYKI